MGIRTRVIVIGWLTLMVTLVGIAVARGQLLPRLLPRPAQPAPPMAAPQPIAAPGDDRAALTETVGLLSGLYLYQTYLNIGLLADGKAERLYDEKAARTVLATVV